MPTFLRALMGAIAAVVIAAGPVLLVFTGPHGDAGLTIAALGFVLIWTPPLFAGIFASYWSFTGPDATRWLRRALAILIGVQVLAAVALIGAFAVTGPGLLVAIGTVALSVVVFPAFVALGRRARRLEAARAQPTRDEWIDTTRADIRRGWRNIAIGFAVGLVIVAALVVVAIALPAVHRHDADLELLFDGAGIAFICGSVGSSVTTFRISRRIRSVIGSDFSAARRIGRALRGKPEPLGADEQVVAGRYARIVGRWLPFQLVTVALLLVGLGLQQLGQLVAGSPSPLTFVILIGYPLLFVALVPLQVVRTRRIRAYAAAHPLSD